jgi:hypothetical protein
MDQHHIGIAPLAQAQRRAGAHGHDPHGDAGGGGELRQQVIEQARIGGRGGRRQGDEAFAGLGGTSDG